MRKGFKKPYKNRKFYFLNQRIQAQQLRVVDDQGKQIGVLSKEEALRTATEREVDLVLIAPQAHPPVAKVIDFRKFLYQEDKKQKEARKGIKKSTVKEIVLSLFVAEADFERFVKKAKEFLDEGHQIRISLNLKGREIAKKPMAFDLMHRFIGELGEVNISKPPRLEGRVIRTVVARKK